MARHRNIRQLDFDDIATYDESLASSIDDDGSISPFAEMYLRSGDNNVQPISLFANLDHQALKFSSEDFPLNADAAVDLSPNHVSGRITSNSTNNEMVSEPHISDHFEFADPFFVTTKNMEELDFDALDRMTFESVPNEPRKPPTLCFPDLPHTTSLSSTMFSKPTMDSLMAGTVALSNTCNKRTTEFISKSKSSFLLPGFVTIPSRLGVYLHEHKSKRRRISTNNMLCFIRQQLFSLARCRTLALSSCIEELSPKPFRFDTPEPVTFDIPKKVICKSAFTTLPAQRQRKRCAPEAPTPNAEVTSTGSTSNAILEQEITQKLIITPATPKHRPIFPSASTPSFSSLNSTPSKPIDRRPLLAEYNEKHSKKEEKQVVNLIVVGHVDAGKSTLMGNLLCQLGRVSNKQLAKYRWESQKSGKASFAFAWVLDQTSEERSRGVTMDIAQTSFETATKRIALMDAPGHKDFVPRVIGGAAQADAALLVVNATNGEFETGFGAGGQTREHARLARLLGVSRLIIAVNKMDTVDWAEARFESIQSKLAAFLKALNLTAVDFCPVSGLTGVNLLPSTVVPNLNAVAPSTLTDWYKGPSLLELIDSIPSPERSVDAPFRFVVSDIFKAAGLGVPAVAGRVLSGGVSAGLNLATSKVLCQASGLYAYVKSMRSLCALRDNQEAADGGLLDQNVKSAFAGDQVALILNGVDPFLSLVPGDIITDPDNPVPLASRIGAKILVFSIKQPITKGYPVIFYYHCTSVAANISRLKSMTHRENKIEKVVKKPRCLPGTCTADVEITLDRPLCLEIYESCKPLGRFMLRVAGESVAGGTVTSVLPPKKNRFIES